VTDERWRDAAIVAANRVGVFAMMFTTARAQRAGLRETLSLVFTALTEGSR